MKRLFYTLAAFIVLLSTTSSEAIPGTPEPPVHIFWIQSESFIIEKYLDSGLTSRTLARALTELGIQHPDVVYRQAMLESGRLKSQLSQKGHNLFGMKRPSRRKTYAVSTYLGHAAYEHWIYSLADYKLWQNGREITGDYYAYLVKRGYATDRRYVSKLKSIPVSDTIKGILNNENPTFILGHPDSLFSQAAIYDDSLKSECMEPFQTIWIKVDSVIFAVISTEIV